MRLSCMQARALMDRRSEGLSDADRLRVESHTATCAACAEHGALLAELVSIAHSGVETGNDASRQRVIARALVQAMQQAPLQEAPALWPRWALGLGLGVALAVALLVLLPLPLALRSGAPWAKQPAPSEHALVIAERPQRFESQAPRRVQIAGATLHLAANTSVAWDPVAARVTLQRGALRAQVQSRAGKTPFSVRTPRFDVVVVGTDFEVTLTDVHVYEGVVRVLSPSGEIRNAAVVAGQRWSIEPDVDEPAQTTDATHAAPMASSRRHADASDPELAPQWIAEARTLLATGDVASARRVLHKAEQTALSLPQRLEVETLVAEAYQVAGDNRHAIAQYDRVARRQPSSVAADNAQFAAARLTLSSGERSAAAERFAQYLQQRPQGRFRAEVERALRSLSSQPAGAER